MKEWPQSPVKQATLCFLVDGDNILLGMKKRGFAEGKWNGFGGKPNEGETILETAMREAQEEVEMTPKSLVQFAILDCYHPNSSLQVVVFLTEEWDGTPVETEEMRPEWFSKDKIPYDDMWEDDALWLPLIIDGKKLKAKLEFDIEGKLLDQEIRIVDSFE